MSVVSRSKGAIVFFAAMTFSCAPLSPDRERPVDVPHSGMKKIASAGRSFEQGWNGSNASYDEKPGMVSSFTYDYWLDSTEVTQKQYYDVTGKHPVSATSQYGAGDNYPVYYVSWFDAVLYCNGRSRAERLDTVYRYSGVKASPSGTVYELTGLWYDVSRDGYRLPTESEWEYAARGGSSALPYSAAADSLYACYYAWYTKNSLGTSHVVATRLANALGLYDMAGNVFEWTNDWKCLYDGKGITNSLGAKDPGGEYEKVIKGGSYNYPFMYLHPSHRSATYATMVSSANEYVGFRCARGIIPNGRYIGVANTDFTPNPVNIMTSAGDFLYSFLKTSDAKLVFVNVTGTNRTLCYVDFSRTFPYVQEYVDDRNVYMPAISPDGRYVAYCSSNEGQTGPSKISIRSLDTVNTTIVQLVPDTTYIPRWWVDPSGGDTCIVYTNSAIDNTLQMWSQTKTFSQRMSGGKAVGDPQELISDGSYHDGLSANGQYAVTGYRHLLMKDVTANAAGVQLFVYPQNGKDASASNQVCNVSMSPDTGKGARCMFLDFGYLTGTSSVTRSSYGAHEYLFVSGMDGTVTDFLHCPAGEQTWDNPSWSNQPRFAVGCVRNWADQAHALYAIDLESKSWKQIITGTELQQPYLRMGNSYKFRPDSLGLYNDPPRDDWQAYIASKILIFWRFYDTLEVAFLGSSQAINGLDPSKITGLMAYNLAAPGGDLLGQEHIILHYLLPRCKKLKFICSSLDIGWLYLPDGNESWSKGVGNSKGFKYDSSHDFWVKSASIIDSIRNLVRSVPLPILTDTLLLGFLPNPSLGWGNNPPDMPPDNWLLLTIDNDADYQKNFTTIRMIADSLRTLKIHWIIVNFPVSPNYRNTNAYSSWGPSWQTARAVLDTLREIASTNGYFHLYDANNDGNHDYDSLEAADENHLSFTGAEKLTARIDSIIHTILP